MFSPVANGLYHSPIEVRGFSQTFEGVVNMRLRVAASGEVLAERTAMGSSVDGFAFFDSYLRLQPARRFRRRWRCSKRRQGRQEIHKVSIP